MRKIFKYRLEQIYRQIIHMPVQAEVLAVDIQHGEITLWAAVDPAAYQTPRIFYTVCTGEDAPAGKHLAMLKFRDGAFILHVFEGNI